VFRYAGGAALRSGEIDASDSFPLHANNRNGKGITTDGTHLWVVNDVRGLDKVYKYTMDGTYVGRWNIDPANAKPTGITIDPTGASDDIWIVDNLTDSVYQYNGGASRTGGSVVADAVFALDASNTNPQGIADPIASTGDAPPVSRFPAHHRKRFTAFGPIADHQERALFGDDDDDVEARKRKAVKHFESAIDLALAGQSDGDREVSEKRFT